MKTPEAVLDVPKSIRSTDLHRSAAPSIKPLRRAVNEGTIHTDALGAAFNAMPAHIALLDRHGVITAVNEAWKRFAIANGLKSINFGVGLLYPGLCDSLTDSSAGARQAASTIRTVLDGEVACAEFDYPCHAPTRQQWFRMTVTALDPALAAGGVVIAHVDVTDSKLADLKVLLEYGAASFLDQAAERLAVATASGRIGIWEWNLTTNVMSWDPRMYDLYGITPEEHGNTVELWTSRLHPDDRTSVEAAVRAAIDDGTPFDTEFRVVWPDGSVHHVRGAGQVVRDQHGGRVRMIGANWDITDARRLTAELAQQHELLRVTLQCIGDAVITTGADGKVTWLNPVAEQMTGWPVAQARSVPLGQVFRTIHEETRVPLEGCLDSTQAQTPLNRLSLQPVLLARDGAEYGIQASAAPIRDGASRVLGTVIVFRDVTEQRRMSREMNHRATHDSLTGLINRPEFEARLRRVLHLVHQEGGQHALLYIDLDQFKLVNDACGHAVADEFLEQIAKLLGEGVGAGDTLARLGGDEFGIILEHCSDARARQVAQQVCDVMDGFRFTNSGRRIRISASIGLVPVDDRWESTAAILQAADISCYAAKEGGRNRVHFWSEGDEVLHTRHDEMRWVTLIEEALDENRFALFAQRIEPLQRKFVGMHAEVLLRMIHREGTVVPPGAFFPAAERFHLASRIDRWVLKHVIAWMTALPSLEGIEKLSVNLSGQSVGDRSFHAWAMQILSEAGPAVCARLCIEITETAAVTNLADAALFIEELRVAGVRIALDDFGAGSSSFGYLKTLAVNYLKIDGQFIHDLVVDPLNAVTVRCFVDVARVMGIETIAEFVDQPETLVRLGELGVDYAQGFLLHRPAPIDSVFKSSTGVSTESAQCAVLEGYAGVAFA